MEALPWPAPDTPGPIAAIPPVAGGYLAPRAELAGVRAGPGAAIIARRGRPVTARPGA
jgi:hypothetical protein